MELSTENSVTQLYSIKFHVNATGDTGDKNYHTVT